MKDTVRLGRVGGVRVGLNWSLLAMVALVATGLAQNRFPFEAGGYSGRAYALAGAVTAIGLLVGVLLHRQEIAELWRRTTQDSLTLVPLAVYFSDGRAKVDLALARGRKLYDKRHAMAKRDADLEARRAAASARRSLGS